jgi:hypothetical protein
MNVRYWVLSVCSLFVSAQVIFMEVECSSSDAVMCCECVSIVLLMCFYCVANVFLRCC